jgi:hypothetical protein
MNMIAVEFLSRCEPAADSRLRAEQRQNVLARQAAYWYQVRTGREVSITDDDIRTAALQLGYFVDGVHVRVAPESIRAAFSGLRNRLKSRV